MYGSSLYHIIDSVVPPSAEEERVIQDSFLRLENICALAIVYKNYDTPVTRTRNKYHEYTLSNLPPILHDVLWKAYLSYDFYRGYHYFDELSQLLCYWPKEEFNLKNLMPELRPEMYNFTSLSEDGTLVTKDENGTIDIVDIYEANCIHLRDFYSGLIAEIFKFFQIFHDNHNRLPEKNNKVLKMKRIDITGYETGSLDIIRSFEIMRNNELILGSNMGKLEIVLDIEIDSDGNDAYILSECSQIKINHVSLIITSFEASRKVKKRIKRIVENGTISINVKYDTLDSSGLLEKIYNKNTWGSNVLSLKLVSCASVLDFLQYLNNLTHLDLRLNNLHGKLSDLSNMPRGLLYLNLTSCNLTNADLYDIKESCHVSTLKELNLDENDLNYDEYSNNLIELCQKLTSLLKLDIYCCKLETWSNKSLSLLFDSLKNMPNVMDITLSNNEFSIDIVHGQIMKLKENRSLRNLVIELPPEVIEGNGKIFSDDLNEK